MAQELYQVRVKGHLDQHCKLHRPARGAFALGLRTRAILAGIVAAALLTLIGVGSRGFHWLG